MTWMDAVRGFAILLLLLWHASAVPALFGGEMPDAIRIFNAFFTPYRMPTLMLLSGILLTRSLKKPLSEYYAGKFAMIVWPYVLWVVIVRIGFFDALGTEAAPWWHWRAWYATSYLWFLFFLGVYYLIAPAFRRIPPWVPLAVAVILALVLPTGGTEQRMAYFAIFFFAGNWLGRSPALLSFLVTRRSALLMGIPAACFGIASCLWTEQLHYNAWGAPASIAGTVFLIAAFARLVDRGKGLRTLQFLGRSSIVYYVSHFPIMALASILWIAQVPPALLVLIGLGAALALGTVLAVLKNRIPVAWLFTAPATVTRLVRRMLSPLDRLRHRSPGEA